jgi:hypothetical protein
MKVSTYLVVAFDEVIVEVELEWGAEVERDGHCQKD